MADDKAKYEISLVDKYSKKLNKIDKETQSFDKQVAGLGKTMAGVFAAGAVVKGMADLAKWSSRVAGDMEQTEIAFNTFLGSAEKGRQVLENLNEFANRTPFTNSQIIKTGRALLAANVPAEEMTGTLQMIGDIAAGTKVPITDLGSIYAKVMNKGKLQAEELNQLAERGVPIIDQLSKEFGVTKQQVFELGSKGKITSDVMVKAFKSMTKEGGKFFRLMEKQSESAVGLLSTLEGKTEMLGVNIGKRLLPAQKKLTKQTISLVDKLNDWVKIPVSENIESERMEYMSLITQLRDVNLKEEDREKILKRLNEINPKTNEIIKKEGDQYEINAEALKKFNEQQINNIILKKEEENIAKVAKKQQELQVERREEELKVARRIVKFNERAQKSTGLLARERKQFSDIVESENSIQEKAIALNKLWGEKTAFKSIKQLQKLDIGRKVDAEDLISLSKELNKIDNDRNSLLDKRNRLAKELGISLGGASSAPVITGRIEGADDVEAGITKITSAAPKVFNINIGNLVENFEVSTTNLSEGTGEIRDAVLGALLEGLADVQPLVR